MSDPYSFGGEPTGGPSDLGNYGPQTAPDNAAIPAAGPAPNDIIQPAVSGGIGSGLAGLFGGLGSGGGGPATGATAPGMRQSLIGLGLGMMAMPKYQFYGQPSRFAPLMQGYQAGQRADLAEAQRQDIAKYRGQELQLQRERMAQAERLASLTGDIREYQYAQTRQGGGFRGSFLDFQQQRQMMQAAGHVSPEQLSKASEAVNGMQRAEQGLGGRFDAAGNYIPGPLELQGTSAIKRGLQGAAEKAGPMGEAAHQAWDPEFNRFHEAESGWISAYRQRNNLPVSEVPELRKRFFPQPGDGPQQMAEKARARQEAMQNTILGTGAYASRLQQRQEMPAAAAPTPGQGAAPVRVNSPEEARKLPKGTRIILPDGRTGTVP